MSINEIKALVEHAIQKVYARDAALFDVDASEWALAHRLAVYLEHSLPEWNVDCEYNRQGLGRDPKTNELDEKIRPDTTVHHRGQLAREHNLLVIEFKKREEKTDWDKVRELTNPPSGKRQFQYQFGLALSFFPTLEMHWFAQGSPA